MLALVAALALLVQQPDTTFRPVAPPEARADTIVVDDERLGDDAARIAHEVLQEPELAGLEVDGLARARDLARDEVERQRPDDEPRGLG